VPCVIQDWRSGEVLTLAYMNAEAMARTRETGELHLWSRSRDELWHKGATSGDVLDLVDVRVNCEQNSLLYRVIPRTGGACHTIGADGRARRACYYRRVVGEDSLEPV
jgi:phosphoribosyl-AMP cyclohydrolase